MAEVTAGFVHACLALVTAVNEDVVPADKTLITAARTGTGHHVRLRA
jgi:hypothetical protein